MEEKINETVNEEVKEVKEEVKPKKNKLQKENEDLKKEIEQCKTDYLYKVAEFENYKKRNARLWADAFNEGKAEVINKILVIGDNLERAGSMELDEKTKEGISLILRGFNETLQNLGVTEINPIGETFDPNVAEALMQTDATDGEESNIVKQVYQKGYKLDNKILRYAKVIVTK